MNIWRKFYSPIGPLYMLPRGVLRSTLCSEEKILYQYNCVRKNGDNSAKMPDRDNTTAVPDSDMKGVPDYDNIAAVPA